MKESASSVKIRKATQRDAPVIASVLRQAFVEYERLYTAKGYAATTPKTRGVRLRMKEGPAWVAVHEGQVVGTASVVLKPAGAFVRGMAVLPVARGLGIGYLLLNEIERFAVADGYDRVFLSTTPFLSRAIRLYETFGFQRTSDGPEHLFGTPLFTMEKILLARPPGHEPRKEGDLPRASGKSCETV